MFRRVVNVSALVNIAVQAEMEIQAKTGCKRCSLLDDNSTATVVNDSAHAIYTTYIRQLTITTTAQHEYKLSTSPRNTQPNIIPSFEKDTSTCLSYNINTLTNTH